MNIPFYRAIRAPLAVVFKRLFKYEAAGPLIPEPCVVVANHVSNLDPVALAIAINPPLRFMAKAEMFQIPLLGALIRAGGAFPVVRGGGGRPAIEAAIQQAKEGGVIAMFPEGTRSHDGNLKALKPGAAIIAIEAGVPVVPVHIDGTYEAMPRGRFLPRLGRKISVVIGSPLETTPYQGDPEGVTKLSEMIREALQELHPHPPIPSPKG